MNIWSPGRFPSENQGAARCHWHGHSPPQRKAAADSRHGYVTSRTPWDPSRVVEKMPILPHENGTIQTKKYLIFRFTNFWRCNQSEILKGPNGCSLDVLNLPKKGKLCHIPMIITWAWASNRFDPFTPDQRKHE